MDNFKKLKNFRTAHDIFEIVLVAVLVIGGMLYLPTIISGILFALAYIVLEIQKNRARCRGINKKVTDLTKQMSEPRDNRTNLNNTQS